jgi:hypothetical protein
MKPSHCQHQLRTSGVFPCDLARNGSAPLYSAAFKAMVCIVCGHTEFYCESHREVCSWLDGRTRNSGASSALKMRKVKAPKKKVGSSKT